MLWKSVLLCCWARQERIGTMYVNCSRAETRSPAIRILVTGLSEIWQPLVRGSVCRRFRAPQLRKSSTESIDSLRCCRYGTTWDCCADGSTGLAQFNNAVPRARCNAATVRHVLVCIEQAPPTVHSSAETALANADICIALLAIFLAL